MSEMQTIPGTSIPALTLGWRLQMALAQAHMSVEGMATELGVSRSTISRWINEHGTPPRAGFLKLWALRCGVPHDWLAYGEQPSATGPEDGSTQAKPSSGWVTADDSNVITLPRVLTRSA